MPIRWNALRVREATDMAEEFISKIKEPLEDAKNVVEEALKIPDIPEYIQQGFRSLMSETERTLGGVYSWNKQPYLGAFDRIIQRIRDDIPADALAREKRAAAFGSQQSLIG